MTAPLATRKSFDLLDMGTYVQYHHRAGIARHIKLKDVEGDHRGWIIMDGASAVETLPMGEVGTFIDGFNYNRVRDMFFDWPRAKMRGYTEGYNKTVMVWPNDGQGWIIGIIRRSIGISSPGYTSGYEYPEWEPGYHHTDMYVDLYLVKLRYEGKEFILCPLWAVQPL